MLRALTLPATLSRVLDPLRSCFTAPSFETFTALVAGLVAQPVGRTVCGILTGAGLARVWHHCRQRAISAGVPIRSPFKRGRPRLPVLGGAGSENTVFDRARVVMVMSGPSPANAPHP